MEIDPKDLTSWEREIIDLTADLAATTLLLGQVAALAEAVVARSRNVSTDENTVECACGCGSGPMGEARLPVSPLRAILANPTVQAALAAYRQQEGR